MSNCQVSELPHVKAKQKCPVLYHRRLRGVLFVVHNTELPPWMIARRNIPCPPRSDYRPFYYFWTCGDLMIPKGLALTNYQQLAVYSLLNRHFLA